MEKFSTQYTLYKPNLGRQLHEVLAIAASLNKSPKLLGHRGLEFAFGILAFAAP